MQKAFSYHSNIKQWSPLQFHILYFLMMTIKFLVAKKWPSDEQPSSLRCCYKSNLHWSHRRFESRWLNKFSGSKISMIEQTNRSRLFAEDEKAKKLTRSIFDCSGGLIQSKVFCTIGTDATQCLGKMFNLYNACRFDIGLGENLLENFTQLTPYWQHNHSLWKYANWD